MDQSPSSSVRVQLLALLRSSHTLLGLIAVSSVTSLWLSLNRNFPFGSYCSLGILAVVALAACLRFVWKGPEVDRGQPVLAISYQESRLDAQIVNVEIGQGGGQQLLDVVRQVVANRRELPAPVGVLQGPASDPKSFRSISPEEAERLRHEDAARLDNGLKDAAP